MPSYKYRIEIYEDENNNLSYGCPDRDLMGYSDINELLKDLENLQ